MPRCHRLRRRLAGGQMALGNLGLLSSRIRVAGDSAITRSLAEDGLGESLPAALRRR